MHLAALVAAVAPAAQKLGAARTGVTPAAWGMRESTVTTVTLAPRHAAVLLT